MARTRVLSLVLGLSIFALDMLSKMWVKNTFWLRDYVVIDGFFTIQHAENSGIAFGYFNGVESSWKPLILGLMAIIALVMVVYYIYSTPARERLVQVALGLLLGGILGNFVDRMIHQHVFDFLKVHWGNRFVWPTFNLADSAITVGVLLILFSTFFGGRGHRSVSEEEPLVTK